MNETVNSTPVSVSPTPADTPVTAATPAPRVSRLLVLVLLLQVVVLAGVGGIGAVLAAPYLGKDLGIRLSAGGGEQKAKPATTTLAVLDPTLRTEYKDEFKHMMADLREDLVGHLLEASDLTVASREQMKPAEKKKPRARADKGEQAKPGDTVAEARKAGEAMGVRGVVTAEVRNVAERTTFQAYLVDVETGHVLWSKQFSWPDSLPETGKNKDKVARECAESITSCLMRREWVHTKAPAKEEAPAPGSRSGEDHKALAKEVSALVQKEIAEQLKKAGVSDLPKTVRQEIAEQIKVSGISSLPQSVRQEVADGLRRGLPAEDKGATRRSVEASEPPLAVLPFAVETTLDEQVHKAVADWPERMAAGLLKDGRLRLVPWRKLKDVKDPIKAEELARGLGAKLLVRGRATREGKKVVVTAELIEADSDLLLWQDRWEAVNEEGAVKEMLAQVVDYLPAGVKKRLTAER